MNAMDAAFVHSPNRAGEHPRAHLKDFTGVLHADGWAGFKGLYQSNRIHISSFGEELSSHSAFEQKAKKYRTKADTDWITAIQD
jgi:hypothetical protein